MSAEALPVDEAPLLTIADVCEFLAITRSQLHRIRSADDTTFPRPVYLQKKETFPRFLKSEVLAWRTANISRNFETPTTRRVGGAA